MKRPNKQDYLTTNQFTYNEKLNEYYEQLEKYVDYCEQQLNLACVSNSFYCHDDAIGEGRCETQCSWCKCNDPNKK